MVPRRRPTPPHRLFAALGDPARIRLLERLAAGTPRSITTLSEGAGITRQAVTKHLAVLADAGLVHDEKHGRERLWSLDPAPLAELEAWAAAFRREWDARFDRLDAWLAADAPRDEEARVEPRATPGFPPGSDAPPWLAFAPPAAGRGDPDPSDPPSAPPPPTDSPPREDP